MKVYVVTSGEYSDKGIERIFSDELSARQYALFLMGNHLYVDVESYDVCESFDLDVVYLRIRYNFSSDRVFSIETSHEYKPEYVKRIDRCFFFSVSASNKQLYNSILKDGMDSKLLKKIAQDKFAEYLYKQGKSKEALLEECETAWRKKYDIGGSYSLLLCSTSSAPTIQELASKDVEKQLNQCLIDGTPLPSITDLTVMYFDAYKKHEQEEDK